MTENSGQSDAGGPLPPKLDLRRIGVKGDAAKTVGPRPTQSTQIPRPGTARSPAAFQPEVLRAPSAETIPIGSVEPPAPAPKLSAPTQPQTIHIKIPKVPTIQTERGQPQMFQPRQTGATVQPPAEAKKKETTRIPLATAQPPTPTVTAAPSAEAPKTIRIKPKAPTAQTQKLAQPGMLAAAPEAAGPSATSPLAGAEKKKTSRISLEAALVADADQEKLLGAKGPKTIRLQRPAATAATFKMGGTPPAPEEPPAAAPMIRTTDRTPMVPTAVSFEETTQIEAPPMTEPEPSGTQRKTIRVKRPTLRPGVTTLPSQTIGVSPSAMEAYRASLAAGGTGRPVFRPDVCNATFPVFAIITLIVVMVTIYMFCSQAFGPNACLTEYSYAKEGPNMAWPGKIPVYRQ